MVTTLAVTSRFRKPLHKCRGSRFVSYDPFIAELDIQSIKQDESITSLVLYVDVLLKKEMRNPLMDLFAIPRPWKVEIMFGVSQMDFLAEQEDQQKQAFTPLKHVQYYEIFNSGCGLSPRLMEAIIRSLPVTETLQECSFGEVALLPEQLKRLQERVGSKSVKHATLKLSPGSPTLLSTESLVHLQSLRIPRWGVSLKDAMELFRVLQMIPNLESLQTVIPIVNDVDGVSIIHVFSSWLEKTDCPLARLQLNQGSGVLSGASSLRNEMLRGLGSNQRLKELAIYVNGDASVVHDDSRLINDIVGISAVQRFEYSCSGLATIKMAQTLLSCLLLPKMETRYFSCKFDAKVLSPEFPIIADMIQRSSKIHRMQELIYQNFSADDNTHEIPLSLWPDVIEGLDDMATYTGSDELAFITTSAVANGPHPKGMRRLNLSSIYQTLQLLTGDTCWVNVYDNPRTSL